MRIIAAATLYFLIVFGVGFLLGPIRVFWLEPWLGETLATFCEVPFILIAIVAASRWLPKMLNLRTSVGSLAGMGLGALFLQQVADFGVGSALRGITPGQQIAHLVQPAGLIYVALLIIFAAAPILANLPHRQFSQPRSTQGGLTADRMSLSPATALRVIKVIHTVAWAFFVSCILAIPIFASRSHFGSVVVVAMIVLIEIAILITNGWRCPLTRVAARYTDDRSDNFDIYLPRWLARHNKLIFGWLFAAVLFFAIVLWLDLIAFGR